MFRAYKTGFDITLDRSEGEEPPRPEVMPRRRVLARPATAALSVATQVDSGRAPARTIRFVSTEQVGLLFWATVESLIALYEDGGAFKLDTDLIGEPGEPTRTYDVLWDERAVPVFTPAANGQRWYMDLALRLTEVP